MLGTNDHRSSRADNVQKKECLHPECSLPVCPQKPGLPGQLAVMTVWTGTPTMPYTSVRRPLLFLATVNKIVLEFRVHTQEGPIDIHKIIRLDGRIPTSKAAPSSLLVRSVEGPGNHGGNWRFKCSCTLPLSALLRFVLWLCY